MPTLKLSAKLMREILLTIAIEDGSAIGISPIGIQSDATAGRVSLGLGRREATEGKKRKSE